MQKQSEQRVCGNCAHYAWANEQLVTFYVRKPDDRIVAVTDKRCPCAVDAMGPDAPGGVALLSPDSHCLYGAQAWEASNCYLAAQAEADDYARTLRRIDQDMQAAAWRTA